MPHSIRKWKFLGLVAALTLVIAACTTAETTETTGDGAGTSDGDATATTAPPAAGGELGEPIPSFEIAFYAADFNPAYEAISRILTENFAELGLDVELVPVEFSTFVEQITVGHNLEEMALGSFGGDPDRLDPDFWISAMGTCDGSHNPTTWCDPEYDALVAATQAELDPDRRRDLVFEAQEYFQDQAPYWQVAHRVQPIVYNGERWTNVVGPAPLSAHESVLDPWLSITPTGDDRILDWAHVEDVSSYNYMIETASAGWLRLVYDPYFAVDEGRLVPWAVESWEFVDETTLRLTLRDGMTFHDGEAVTAEDAVYTLNTFIQLQPPTIADVLANLVVAEQVDELTFDLTLQERDPKVLSNVLTDLIILPEHILSTIDDPLGWDPVADDNVIGSGPFVFESWLPNEVHVLSVHDDHFAAPDYDGVRRLALGQADAIRQTLIDGTADMANQVLPASAMEQLAQEYDHLEFLSYPSLSTQVLWMNLEVPPFGDIEFRKALRMASNVERAAFEGWIGYGLPAGPGNIPNIIEEWHNPNLETISFDIEAARQALAEAGYGWDDEGNLHLPPS